jgi:hypothetical protein
MFAHLANTNNPVPCPHSPGSPERPAKRLRVEDREAPCTPRNATQAPSLKENPISPPSPDVRIKQRVDHALSRVREKIKTFLRKVDLYESWRPSCDDKRVAEHLAQLRIPFVGGKPRLLLHDLGGSIVEPGVVDGVFDEANTWVYLQVAKSLRTDCAAFQPPNQHFQLRENTDSI